MSELVINPRFKDLLPPLTNAEFEQLEKSVLDEGIREPIRVWQGQIVDGYNRYELAQSYDLPYKVVDVFFEDEDAACEWMITNQLGRRNIEPNIKALLLGQYYQLQKKKVGAPEGNQNASENNGATVAPLNLPKRTAESVAEQFDVSPRTVNNAAKVYNAFESAPEPVREQYKKGEISQKKLVETSVPPAETETRKTSVHINNLKLHGGRISQAAKDLLAKIEEYETYIFSAKLDVKSFAPVLHDLQNKQILDDMSIFALGLKSLEVCPKCDEKGCQRCGHTGYLDKQNAEYVRKETANV